MRILSLYFLCFFLMGCTDDLPPTVLLTITSDAVEAARFDAVRLQFTASRTVEGNICSPLIDYKFDHEFQVENFHQTFAFEMGATYNVWYSYKVSALDEVGGSEIVVFSRQESHLFWPDSGWEEVVIEIDTECECHYPTAEQCTDGTCDTCPTGHDCETCINGTCVGIGASSNPFDSYPRIDHGVPCSIDASSTTSGSE